MKKRILFVSAICLVLLLTLTGCGSKKAITTEEFKSIAGEKGMLVVDVLDQFEETDILKEATVAVNSGGWQIEFYVLVNDDEAVKAFNHNKDIFEESKTGSSLESNVSLKNYSSYVLKSDGYYMNVIRLDNTLVYLKVVDEYEEAAKSFVKKMGY